VIPPIPPIASRAATSTSDPPGTVIRDAQLGDWQQIWSFFRDTVADGETYAYADDLTQDEAMQLWVLGWVDQLAGWNQY
jgi:hypothetical protein